MLKNGFLKDLQNKKSTIAIIGLGYVGIPLFVKLGKHFRVIGFDINKSKLKNIIDRENVEDFPELDELDADCTLTSDETKLKDADFFIVTVPTPIDKHNNPDLKPVVNATEIIGRNMPEGSIIVYESTGYP
ncbi:MAG: nucleotide sugar dehydrogenase, partial [Actinobacteria bacterium]|nr:nucleotide sugar dehydrogenase [Actinomycetota bacterium]